MTGLHRQVTLSFMMVGHTKFAPDWCFGLFKQRYRRTFVSSLDDITDVVNSSADVNVAQLVGTQNGESVVPMYDWTTFLRDHFRNVPHMKTFHHFTFTAAHPGVVVTKEFSDSAGTKFTMLHDMEWCPTQDELPPINTPLGLSSTRQWYLYKEIREYCRHGTEDSVCPKPSVPEDEDECSNGAAEEETSGAIVPQAKRARRCGKCGGEGHNRRTCSNN